MKLVDLLNLANQGYSDMLLATMYDETTGELLPDADQQGDTLALFIVRELTDTFDIGLADENQRNEAVRVLLMARQDIDDVINCLANLEATAISQQ